MAVRVCRQALVVGSLVLVATLASAVPASALEDEPGGDREKVVLALPWSIQFQFAGYVAAIEQGYYDDAGLDVDLVEGDLDSPPADLLAKGRADFGVLASELLYERLRGRPFVALAVVMQHSPYALMARHDSGITSPRDLVGKRVELGLTFRDAEFLAMLRSAGVSPDDVVQVRRSVGFEDVMSGRSAAAGVYVTNEPHLMEERGIPVTLIRPVTYGIDFYGDTLFTTESELDRHPGRAERFRKASLRGWSYAFDHPDELVDVLLARYGAAEAGLTREHLRREAAAMRPLVVPDLVELGTMSTARWEKMAATLERLGFVDSVDIDGFVYEPPRTGRGGWALPVALAAAGALGFAVWGLRQRRRATMQRRELQFVEQRYQDGFEASPLGLAIEGPDGRYLRVNPAFCAMLGRSEEYLVGRASTEVIATDDDPATEAELLATAPEARREERRFSRPDGTIVHAQVHSSELRDASGEPDGWFVQVEDVTDRLRAESELAHQATHDTLTGLANRALLLDHLELALQRRARSGGVVGVAFVDLDDFKRVNDSLGHVAGDRLLVAAAERLREVVRPGDTVARFGGDEFVVLCEDVDGTDGMEQVAGRLLVALRRPFRLGDVEAVVTGSCGIVVARPGPVTPEGLLRDADVAMYKAKERGRDRTEVFAAGLRARVLERLSLEQALRRAIERDELRVMFQPEVELATGHVVGVESLVRWQHPEWGLVGPARFLPLAEETGLVADIDTWVFGEACQAACRWQRYLDAWDGRVWVNVSARQLSNPALPETLARLLAVTAASPDHVGIEVTETVAMSEDPTTEGVLAGLTELGLGVAIDDFGTGYSSLAYLKRLPARLLKLDRSLVLDLGQAENAFAIAKAAIDMGHALGLRVVGEGVERIDQWAALRSLGCDAAQGYYLAIPRDIAGMGRLLEAGGVPVS